MCHCVATCVTDDAVCLSVCMCVCFLIHFSKPYEQWFICSCSLSISIPLTSLCSVPVSVSIFLSLSSTSCSFHFLLAYAILGHTIDPFRLNKQTSSCCIQILARSPRLECTLLHPLPSLSPALSLFVLSPCSTLLLPRSLAQLAIIATHKLCLSLFAHVPSHCQSRLVEQSSSCALMPA